MPDNDVNNTDVNSLDINLENLYDPTNPSSTGNPSPTPPASTSPVEPVKPVDSVPPVSNVNDDDNSDNNKDSSDTDIIIKSIDDLKSLITNKKAEEFTETENEELLDIAEAFGGSSFNTDGALLDLENNILFTPEQVKAYLETGELPVDDNGDFVDANGEVVKTKAELFRATTTVGTVMNALSKNFNVAFKPTYLPEDTEDSLVEVVSKVVSVVESTAVKKYFDSNPELEAFRKHLLLNGTPDNYKASAVEYDKIVIKDLSKEAKKAYIVEAANAIGKPLTTKYLAYLDSLKDEDYNLEVAQNLTVLKEQQDKRQQETSLKLQQQKEAQERETNEYWDNVTNTVKNGKLANINIPIPERDAFLAYLTEPVQNGKSKDMLDAEKDDVAFDLLVSYFRFKNKDISQLARNIASTDKVQSMRERLNKNKNRNFNSDKGQKPKTQDNYIPGLNDIIF